MNGATTIDELQDRLGDNPNLNEVEGCRQVISLLLLAIKDREKVAEHARDLLKNLAMMVLNGNPEVVEKAKEYTIRQGKEKYEVMEFLLKMVDTMTEAENMTDENLVTEVLERIWQGMDMSSRESSLLGELIHRFKQSKQNMY
jgi:hypothetical protein